MVLQIGHIIGSPYSAQPTKVICEDPDLAPFAHLKCLHADVAQRYGLAFTYPEQDYVRPAVIDPACLSRHLVVEGNSGQGKSRMLQLVLTELLRSGMSAVIVEPKLSAVRDYVRLARQIGIPARHVFLLSQSIAGAIPRFSLFAQNLPPKEVADGFVDALEGGTTNQLGALRRHDFLLNCALLAIMSGRDNSPDEMLRALQDTDYREALRANVDGNLDPWAWSQASRFFDEIKKWPRNALIDAVGPATRLLREAVNSETLYSAWCALNAPDRSCLHLDEFWQTQNLLIVHSDADVSGFRSSLLFAGILLKMLFSAAKRIERPERAVVACLDELPELSRFAGKELARLVSQARSAHLQLLLSCQHRSQLPSELRETLHQCSIAAFFRQDHDLATSLAHPCVAVVEPPIAQVMLTPLRTNDRLKSIRVSNWRHPVVDEHNRPLAVSSAIWNALRGAWSTPGLPLAHVYALAEESGIRRLFVREPGTDQPVELREYVRQLVGCTVWFEGPAICLCVVFPRTKPERTVRRSTGEMAAAIASTIATLPQQTTLLSVDGQVQGIVRIANVPDLPQTPDDDAYLSKIIAVNGQTRAETLATLQTRSERMQMLVDGGLTGPAEGKSDDSAW